MKIDQQVQAGTTASTAAAQGSQATSGSALKSSRPEGHHGGDSVNLSGPFQIVRSSESTRASRIASLTQAFRSGSYSVSPQAISAALVKETLANGAGPDGK